MSKQDNWDAEWAGLDPGGRHGGPRWVLLIALIALVCLLGTALLAWQFLARTAVDSPALIPPETPTAVAQTTSAGATVTAPSIAATATLPGETRADVVASRLAAAPVIDADVGDWAPGTVAAGAVASPFLVYSAPAWDGSDDLAADWRLGWDADNLYLFVTVTDDTHVQTQTGNQIFNGDGISLQFDTQRAADLGPGLSPDDIQIDLSAGDFAGVPPVAFRFRGSADGRMSDAPGARIALAGRPTGSGYVIEAAIPWVDLGVQPQAGLVLGVALNVNDNDTPGTAVQEVMKSHISTRQFSNPASWGTLRLEE